MNKMIKKIRCTLLCGSSTMATTVSAEEFAKYAGRDVMTVPYGIARCRFDKTIHKFISRVPVPKGFNFSDLFYKAFIKMPELGKMISVICPGQRPIEDKARTVIDTVYANIARNIARNDFILKMSRALLEKLQEEAKPTDSDNIAILDAAISNQDIDRCLRCLSWKQWIEVTAEEIIHCSFHPSLAEVTVFALNRSGMPELSKDGPGVDYCNVNLSLHDQSVIAWGVGTSKWEALLMSFWYKQRDLDLRQICCISIPNLLETAKDPFALPPLSKMKPVVLALIAEFLKKEWLDFLFISS